MNEHDVSVRDRIANDPNFRRLITLAAMSGFLTRTHTNVQKLLQNLDLMWTNTTVQIVAEQVVDDDEGSRHKNCNCC